MTQLVLLLSPPPDNTFSIGLYLLHLVCRSFLNGCGEGGDANEKNQKSSRVYFGRTSSLSEPADENKHYQMQIIHNPHSTNIPDLVQNSLQGHVKQRFDNACLPRLYYAARSGPRSPDTL